MKKSKPPTFSVDYLHEILEYNPSTGDFIWKTDRSSNKVKNKKAGHKRTDGYREIRIDNRLYLEHLLAWYYITEEWPEQLDHKNGIRHENNFDNLRLANDNQNQANRGKNKNNKSGHKGVTWNKFHDKWQVGLKVDKKHYHVGYFNDLEKAAEAYKIAALDFYGEFARWN